jgi:hypothetical protein
MRPPFPVFHYIKVYTAQWRHEMRFLAPILHALRHLSSILLVPPIRP